MLKAHFVEPAPVLEQSGFGLLYSKGQYVPWFRACRSVYEVRPSDDAALHSQFLDFLRYPGSIFRFYVVVKFGRSNFRSVVLPSKESSGCVLVNEFAHINPSRPT